jgi:DNA-binding NarL/FixJ family response regulator
LRVVHVLLATDAGWLVDEVVAAVGGTNTSFTVCTEGREVSKVIAERAARGEPVDIGIFDLQIGTMGGIAVTMALRLDASAGNAPEVPVLVLLDRVADVHLARRSGADGWLVKPLDPLRLRRAVKSVLAGTPYTEGLAGPPPPGGRAVVAESAEPEEPAEPASADPVASG